MKFSVTSRKGTPAKATNIKAFSKIRRNSKVVQSRPIISALHSDRVHLQHVTCSACGEAVVF